ncbi:MAG: 4Fe-4S binding protein [Gammaproteobacteria bacterium]|nr:4Fe-4S binding protein [Gammaproteobacteria bacterium]MDH3536464.1 4Fe-4S binding protein [Gammaproteobacteria bacterium]
MSNSDARQRAFKVRDAFAFEPTSLVTYRSAGRIIALGDDDALRACDEIAPGLNFIRVSASGGKVEVDGYLGAYTVSVSDQHGNLATYQGDAILDLNENPLLTREMLPPGYFHAQAPNSQSDELREELENLVGEFQKPKYFDYDPSICAHGVNGKTVCTQCIDACPAEAIASIGERIEVNPNLCQGGGVCTTVCPSGAIRYLYPNLRDSGQRLRKMLDAYHEQGGTQAIVLFHSEGVSPDHYLEAYDNLLPIQVEELASVGMDLGLSALAYGAMQVVLLADERLPRSSLLGLQQQLDWLHAIITELGLGSAYVTICRGAAALPEVDGDKIVKAAIQDMPPLKRNAIYQALDYLVNTLRPQSAQVRLPASAPFGDVAIDAGKCTLCMACVGACPGRALQDGSNREVPEVFFIESNCLQCGACVQTCPEDAVSLAPRMLFDREKRNRARSLNSDTPFACISCGKPFAPTSVINKMQEKLKDHYMFGSQRALERLKMCENCRVADVVLDPEAMGGQFDPLKGFRQ